MTRGVTACAAALALLTASVAAAWSPLVRVDGWLSGHAFAATYAHDTRTAVWTSITDAAAPEPMRTLLLLAAVVALALHRVDVAVWWAALSFLEAVVAPASKDLLDRPRPEWTEPITVLASTSYPSGHATAAATTAVAVALVVRHRAVVVGAVLLAVPVAASRVYLGAHYPSDVVAGLLLGTLLATTTYAVMQAVAGAVVRRADPEVEEVGTRDARAGTSGGGAGGH